MFVWVCLVKRNHERLLPCGQRVPFRPLTAEDVAAHGEP